MKVTICTKYVGKTGWSMVELNFELVKWVTWQVNSIQPNSLVKTKYAGKTGWFVVELNFGLVRLVTRQLNPIQPNS